MPARASSARRAPLVRTGGPDSAVGVHDLTRGRTDLVDVLPGYRVDFGRRDLPAGWLDEDHLLATRMSSTRGVTASAVHLRSGEVRPLLRWACPESYVSVARTWSALHAGRG